ncbi:MAG: Hsp20/alpha crystallin family protein [Saprospiraceae bacterium]|nr:Hsp20/alpha crystallin family protein [Saprospiraceae bacterium]
MHTKFRKNPGFRNAPIFSNLLHEVLNTPVQDVVKDQEKKYATPAANIVEYTDKYEISVALPGFQKEQIDIHMENNQLVITTERENGNSQGKAIYRELYQPNFKRVFTLSDKVNKENIGATYNNGILVLSLTKAEDAKPKSITIL